MKAVGAALPVAHRIVEKTLNDLEAHSPAVDPPDDDTTTAGAEVDRCDCSAGHQPTYRKNAAAMPESTGMWRPVVRLSSGPVST